MHCSHRSGAAVPHSQKWVPATYLHEIKFKIPSPTTLFFIHVGKHLTRRKKERNFVFEKMHKPETAGTFGKSKPGFYHQVMVIFTIFCFQSPVGSTNCLFTGI